MTTLIPTTSSSQPTGAAVAAATAAGVEAYEDMFKEITRKLYGDESAHGLYPHNTQVAQVAQLAPGAPSAAPEGGERSFTTLVSDRNITTIDYETTTVNDQQQQQQQGGQQRSEEHLTTAFGLAALMQNGFPPPGAILNPVNFPGKANLVAATSDDRWQQEQPTEQSWNASSGGKHSSTSSYSHHKSSFKKPKVEPQDGSPTGGSSSTLNIPQSDKNKGFSGSPSATSVGAATGKRYACTSCPYTTDRRDLFTRHENIHKEEKPFHCYACLKQFNRADHVKKHFMRMHRDMDYEIAKTRRITAASSSSSSSAPSNAAKPYYSSSSSSNTPVSAPAAPPAPTTVVSPPVTVIPVVSTLNIPTANFPTTQLSIPTSHHHAAAATTTIESSSHNSIVTAVVNSHHNIITLNGGNVVHHHQQQQQNQHQQPVQQQQQQQIIVAPQIVTIKQEKGVLPRDAAGNSGNSVVANLVDEKPFAGAAAKKIKGEKRFTCCYCPWSGADNWGLKRHLNTHTKPYVCMLCDYKAARSERLATHVFKVHNKKACSKCTFFAEDQDQLNAHMQDSHLLTMQALGRNKASVTQDFHNAGGGTHHRQQQYHHLNDSTNSSDSNSSNAGHSPSSSPASRSPSPPVTATAPASTVLSEEHLSLLQLLATAAVAQQHLQLQQQQQQKSAILSSPPANLNLNSSTNPGLAQQQQQVETAKRRRKSSSRNDKENLGQKQQRTVAVGGKVIDLTVTAGPVPGDGIERNNNNGSSNNNNSSSVNNKNINEAIFDRVMYKKPASYQNLFLTTALCKPVLGAATEKDQQHLRKEDRVIVAEKSFSLAEFLRNHTEVSITTTAKGAASTENDDDVVFIKEENRRKQQAPRKVDQRTVGDIRDKHMIRLITRRLCCRICQNQTHRNGGSVSDNCHYHSKTSLILHNRWRHRGQPAAVPCRKCGQSFPRKYKLALHQKLVHRGGGAGSKPKKVAPKQQRKQRKRKPKSRCFTKRRK